MIKLPKNFNGWQRIDSTKNLPSGLIVPDETPKSRSYYKVNPDGGVMIHSIRKNKKGMYNIETYYGKGVWTRVSVDVFDIMDYYTAKKILMLKLQEW